MEPGLVRIGELSRRVGVSAHLLRAWERRYGLLRPQRSPGGYRLYSEGDESRVNAMRRHMARGLSAAEAARLVLAVPEGGNGPSAEPPGGAAPEGMRAAMAALTRALERFDEPAAQDVLDRMLAAVTVETVIRDLMMPFLREVGERWRRDEVSVAQEHFVSNVIRGRLAGLSRGSGRGHGPRALLACPPGERHDIPLLAFGVALHRTGWRVAYLGADTPMDDVLRAATDASPQLVVLAAVNTERFAGVTAGLAELGRRAPLALGGRGATEEIAGAPGARLLAGDPVTAAAALRPAANL